jgi:hypothetical protein
LVICGVEVIVSIADASVAAFVENLVISGAGANVIGGVERSVTFEAL